MSSVVTIIGSFGFSTCFVGIFSGWRRSDVVGKGRVEPEEDQRSFENMGKNPRAPKRGVKKFQNFEF